MQCLAVPSNWACNLFYAQISWCQLGMRSCKMSSLSAHLGHELNGVTVVLDLVSEIKDKVLILIEKN